MRELDADCRLLPGAGSRWRTLSILDVLGHLDAQDEVGRWLREKTPVDCSAERLATYTDPAAGAVLRHTDVSAVGEVCS